MNRTAVTVLGALALGVGTVSSPVYAQRIEQGELAAGDQTLDDGEYLDIYTFQGRPEQRVALILTSQDFDTFLLLIAPSGNDTQNDDYEGNNRESRIEAVLDEAGEWRVGVTSYQSGETGRYTLRMDLGGGQVAAAPAAPMGMGPQTHRGELSQGDETLKDGEYGDIYTFQGVAGGQARIELRSTAFDTYLFVVAPDGTQEDNDDASQGETTRSLVELQTTVGEYRVVVTSYQSGETGPYQLTIDAGGGAVAATPGRGGDRGKNQVAAGPRVETGRLESGDETLDDGEYIDSYTFEGRQGQRAILDLRAQGFDPYLLLRGPNEQSQDNDDHEGDRTRSLIVYTLEADGTYRVGVTSYQADETGSYELRIDLGDGGGAAAAVAAGPRHEAGELRAGDDSLNSGEFVDVHTFEGSPGQRADIVLSSNDFDTYLIVIDPAGEQKENDDDGSTNRSRVEQELTEPGEYRILVTTYQPGETGAYTLDITLGGGAAAPAQQQQRDVTTIAMGQTLTGQLESGDGQLDNGEYRDLYVFNGQAGQNVTVDMQSQEFDTYLGLLTPNGEDVQNDDYEGSTKQSRIEMTLRETGRYRIVATSYAEAETGTYQVRLTGGGAPQPVAARPAQPGAQPAGDGDGDGRIFGVFTGISDYGGRASNLPYTADDAIRVRNALIEGAGMDPNNGILLTDAQVTTGGVHNAIQQLAGRMGPNDTFIFFYSGHGSRVPRPGGGFQVTDPDGMDETIEFVDAGVTDDQFNEWMNEIQAGRILLWLDACFSGGFSKDVISRPGRMGMFSSEEDVTSSVAAKFRAGGYLAVFLADAIQSKLADIDGDGQISAIELSQYVHERYRADLKSGNPGDFVRTGGPQLGFQHLVVDLGSIGPYDILFR